MKLATTRPVRCGITLACLVTAAVGQIATARADIVGEMFTGIVTAGTEPYGQTASGGFVYDTSQLYSTGPNSTSTTLPGYNPTGAQSNGVFVSISTGGATYNVKSGGSNASSQTVGTVTSDYGNALGISTLLVDATSYNPTPTTDFNDANVALNFNQNSIASPPTSLLGLQVTQGSYFSYHNVPNGSTPSTANFSGNINTLQPLAGLSPNNPILPSAGTNQYSCGNGSFLLCYEGALSGFGEELAGLLAIGIWIDPAIATGYDLKMVSGGTFQAVEPPPSSVVPNPGDYTLTAGADTVDVAPGAQYTFDQGGVGEFDITGIDPALMLDPNNPLAFPIELFFDPNGDPIVFEMNPITGGTGTQVPEPDAIYLLGAGLMTFVLLSVRRRWQRPAP